MPGGWIDDMLRLLAAIRELRQLEEAESPYGARWYQLLARESDAIDRLKQQLGPAWSRDPQVVEWLIEHQHRPERDEWYGWARPRRNSRESARNSTRRSQGTAGDARLA
jgi:hypothetical protein